MTSLSDGPSKFPSITSGQRAGSLPRCRDSQVFAVPMREGRAARAARPVQSDASVARFRSNRGDQVLQQERSLHFEPKKMYRLQK